MQNYARWNINNEHRAYYMVHNVLYDMADEYFKNIEKNVTVKNRETLCIDRMKESGRNDWMADYRWYFPIWFKKGRPQWAHVQSENFFRDNSQVLINGFFVGYGYKDIADAIKQTATFNFLCYQWDVWYEEKRRRYMRKYKNKVEKMGKQVKTPSSHGGIANLLKTLTKTMELQGASIQSVAKVQYTICMQAGVYIPDEFITDVNVAVDYEKMIGE